MAIFEEVGETKRIVDTASTLGSIQAEIGCTNDALKSFFYALDKINKSGKYLVTKGNITNNIGVLYHNIDDLENALKFYLESYEIFKQEKMNYALPITAYNIATIYF